jgi:uncharacterized protein YukE
MTASYQNEFQQWCGQLPPPVQYLASPLLAYVNDALEWVAGHPDDLVSAAATYPVIAQGIADVVAQQRDERHRLGRSWDGDAHDAFQARLATFEEMLERIATAVRTTPEILYAGAQACRDGANMIIDLVVMTVELIIAYLAVNAALSVVTGGISIAAGAAEGLATCANSAAKIGTVVQKVGQVLTKMADVLRSIARHLQSARAMLEFLQRGLAELDEAASAERFLSKGWVLARSQFTVADRGMSLAIEKTTGVSVPGDTEAAKRGWDAGREIGNLSRDVDRALNPDPDATGG